MLDEAFTGVDFASQEGVIDVLRSLRDEGKTILMATHDLNSLSDRFDEVLCINRHICAHGSPQSVFTDEVLKELNFKFFSIDESTDVTGQRVPGDCGSHFSCEPHIRGNSFEF